MKHRTAVLGAVAAVALGMSSLGFGLGSAGAAIVDHVTICHRTNSNTNPYVQITPDVSGVLDGHAGHTGPVWDPTLKAQHIKWGDIIPPFDYDGGSFPGMNWTTEGQAIYDNGCAPVTPPPPPELVDLSVAKSVVGTVPEGVTGFTATVTCDEDAPIDVTLPVGGGVGTPSSIQVEVGSQCTVVETATGGADSVSYDVPGVDVSPGVFVDADTTVTVTNTFDPPTVGPETVVSPAEAAAAPAVVAAPRTTG